MTKTYMQTVHIDILQKIFFYICWFFSFLLMVNKCFPMSRDNDNKRRENGRGEKKRRGEKRRNKYGFHWGVFLCAHYVVILYKVSELQKLVESSWLDGSVPNQVMAQGTWRHPWCYLHSLVISSLFVLFFSNNESFLYIMISYARSSLNFEWF